MRLHPRITFLSTYPPTRCGLATFTQSLLQALAIGRGSRRDLSVIAVEAEPGARAGDRHADEVVAVANPQGRGRLPRIATDVLIVQHEFGIYGPDDGARVLDLIDEVPVDAVVVFHTVLRAPSERQRSIVEQLAEKAAGLIVLSESARRSLRENYELSGRPVAAIPHGASLVEPRPRAAHERPMILTWGLLGPGKGLEAGIDALAKLRHLRPRPLYVIAGQTHPNVLRDQGERYRYGLLERAHDLGVSDMVRFVDHYLTDTDLTMLRSKAQVALLPYDSREQVTSGALVEALAARIPVVATRFPHALELLSRGAGELVVHGDADAIALGLERLLTDPAARASADEEIRRLRRQLSWRSVAAQYEASISTMRVEAGAA